MPEEMKPCPNCGSYGIESWPTKYVPDKGYVNFQAVCVRGCHMRGPMAETEEDAIESWNSLPRTLTWSNARPTKPGFYFHKTLSGHLCTAEVKSRKNGELYVWSGAEKWEWLGQWAGPIPEPEDI